MTIKEIFDNAENGTLTFEQFTSAAKDAKFVDLAEGKYVSKQKFEDELGAKDTQINDLNSTLATRDTDLKDLKTKLEEAGTDSAKLTELNSKLSTLQGKYDEDTKAYQNKLDKQAYEFAVKEFANSKNFTSKAAKRDFISSLVAENLKLDNNKIMGADDFVAKYTEANDDAFVVEEPEPTEPTVPEPSFVAPTSTGTQLNQEQGFGFNFIGVRPHEAQQ